MSRGERSTQAYNLPPLKSSDSLLKSKPAPGPVMENAIQEKIHSQKSYLLKERHKDQQQPNGRLGGAIIENNIVVLDTMSSIRGTMSSPAPKEHLSESLDGSSFAKQKELSGFPAITVQKCDESSGNSPRNQRKRGATISDTMRTLSANNLYVPSPLTQRKENGRTITFTEGLSRSDDSLTRCANESQPEKDRKTQPFSAPVTRPTVRSSYDIAADEFRRNREMYSPSTPRRPVRLIALSDKSRSHSAGDVNSKRKL